MVPQDISQSDDGLIACLERRGWKTDRISEIQASIAEKMTPDLFTGKMEKLTGGEVMFQEEIDKCLEQMKKEHGRSKGSSQPGLFLAGEKLTCVETQKVPGDRSKTGFVVRCKRYEPTEGAACVEETAPVPVEGFSGEKMSCISWQKTDRGWRCEEFMPTCRPGKETLSLTNASMDQIRDVIWKADGLGEKYTFEDRASGGRHYKKSVRTWEKAGNQRIYVPSSAYGEAGYIVIKGSGPPDAQEYKGLRLAPERNRPQEKPNIQQLKEFVDDLELGLTRLK